MGSRKKLKYVVVIALLLGLIALLVMTIILLTSKSEQDGSEILLRIQESSTTTATPQTTEIEIFLGCFNVSNNVSALLDSCQLMKEDGHCDDICNYPSLNFDGGDCCQEVIDRSFCSDCFCYQDCSRHPDAAEFCFKSHANNTNDACNSSWISDGNCDDGCNVPELNFDGGDCCQESNLFMTCHDCFCYQDCSIHFEAKIEEQCFEAHPNTNEESCIEHLINDGFCDDECNFPHHNYDGGDCCEFGPLHYCSQCFCYQSCSAQSFTQGCLESWTNDGLCDDDCNFPQFDYDGGDCCLETLISTFCSDCFCHQNSSQQTYQQGIFEIENQEKK